MAVGLSDRVASGIIVSASGEVTLMCGVYPNVRKLSTIAKHPSRTWISPRLAVDERADRAKGADLCRNRSAIFRSIGDSMVSVPSLIDGPLFKGYCIYRSIKIQIER
jgi:hypothetical protein